MEVYYMGTVHKNCSCTDDHWRTNWGLAGLFRFDVVAELAGGSTEPLARLIYIIIGVSGLINLGFIIR